MLTIGCGHSLDGSSLDVDRLCSLSAAGHKTQDFSRLLTELERQVGVARNKIRVTREGMFVPVKKRFVEESGYFVAKPGVDAAAKGTDSTFEPIRGCVYHQDKTLKLDS